MEQNMTQSAKLLNSFLRLMVGCLVAILVAIPVLLILDLMGLV